MVDKPAEEEDHGQAITVTLTRRRITPHTPGPKGLGVFRLVSRRFVRSMEALYRWANCADSHWQNRRYAKSLRVKFALLLHTSSPTDSGTDCPGNRCTQESVTPSAAVDSARL